MDHTEGPLTELCTEHRSLDALLGRLDRARAGAGDRPGADGTAVLLAELHTLLDAHRTTAEAHLHPLVRRYLPAGNSLADAAAHTHAAIGRLLAEAMDERFPAAHRDRCAAALLVVTRAHLRGEEERLLPALRGRTPPEELRRCAHRMGEERRRAGR